MGKDIYRDLVHKRRHLKEEKLNILALQENVNPNHKKMSTRAYLNDHYFKIVKKTEMTNFSKDVEIRESLCTVGGNVNWCSLHGLLYVTENSYLIYFVTENLYHHFSIMCSWHPFQRLVGCRCLGLFLGFV